MKNDFKVIGKTFPLRDGKEKVSGSAQYSADVKLDDMLHAKMLCCPYPHAKIAKIDVNQAEAIDGVVEILTYKNVPKILFAPMETRPMFVLSEKVRYVGEPVAVVAAESEEIADKALEAIKVEYERLPAVFNPVEAAKSDAPKLHPISNIIDPVEGEPLVVEWGDLDGAFKEADIIVGGTFKTPIQSVAPIEPRACVASWDGEELTAWVSTQFPHRVKDDLAEVLRLPFCKIKVISHYFGGGFGGKKQEEYPLMASLLSMRTKRPVKLEYSREEETIAGRRRYSAVENIKLAAKNDGTITAIDCETYYDVGAHGNYVGGSLGFFGSQLYMYNFGNAIFKTYDVNTNLPTAQPFRGVQFPSYLFGLEQLIEQVGEKSGIDPIEIRLRNSYRTGDLTKPYGARLSNYKIEECIEKCISASGFRDIWKGWDKPVRAESSKRRGIGVGLTMGYTDWQIEICAATVKIYPEGTVELFTGAQDIGTGCNTTLPQLVAEELGVPLDRVKLTAGNTGLTPDDFGACASRTLYCNGLAIQGAVQKAREALIDTACRCLNAEKADIEFREGEIYVKGKKVPLSEIIKEPISGTYKNEARETVAPLCNATYVGPAVFHVAEIEVDMETGEVEVLKYTAVQDAGKAINPPIVEGQMYGGALQGLGYALKEELLFDESSGRILTPNFMDYKIYNFQDAPDIRTIIIESNEPTGPFGAMGVGEHCISPVAATIANAVYNAIGVRLYEIPMTPERILEALGRI
ncbi:xanthine dehydrogenase family protein molybdopterin-binding subunit [Chloroflexota bacterium]